MYDVLKFKKKWEDLLPHCNFALIGRIRETCQFYVEEFDYLNNSNNDLMLNNFKSYYEKNKNIINFQNFNFKLLKKCALLGNPLAPLEILKKYNNNQDEYLFWLLVGAENGNKNLQLELGEWLINNFTTVSSTELNILKLKKDELFMRGNFWIELSNNNLSQAIIKNEAEIKEMAKHPIIKND